MHSVFVSSTYLDLAEHRQAVQSALRQLGAVDISMENFGARDERPKEECLRLISKEADSFIGIYAHRYGFVPKKEKKSITEAEYDAAAGLPRFVYIVNDEALWLKKFIDTGGTATRLTRFKDRLRSSHICKHFSSKDELATSVAADIGRHLLKSSLPRISSAGGEPSSTVRRPKGAWSPDQWNSHRYGVYQANHDFFLVHTLAPSTEPGQLFDIFIYIHRHKSADLAEIAKAEFFLGPYWHNRVFSIANKGGPVGITTSAYGEFLCVCRVLLRDGTEIFLDRYINFAEFARSDD